MKKKPSPKINKYVLNEELWKEFVIREAAASARIEGVPHAYERARKLAKEVFRSGETKRAL